MKKLILLIVLPFYLLAQQKGEKLVGETSAKIDSYLSHLAKERNYSGGLLIIKNGETTFSKGYGWANQEEKIPFTSATLGSMGSITKAFTASGILKLYQNKKLKLTDPLKKFFPGVPADKQSITIHQLLTHSGGFVEFLAGDEGDFEKIEAEEYLKRVFAQSLGFTPGSKAVYTNVGMSILGIIIEKVSGLDYESFLRLELFLPNKIQSIGYQFPAAPDLVIAHGYQSGKDWGTHPIRYEKAGGGPYWNLKANGGLEASLDDMTRWANAISNKTLLPDSLIEKMFTAQILEDGYGGNSFFGYGCNISKSRRGTKMIDNGGSNGIYHARMIRLPEEGVVFYMITNENSLNTNQVLPNVTQLYFDGNISRDFTTIKFDHPQMNKIYDLLTQNDPAKFESLLNAQNIKIQDDMILLEVGQRLIKENNLKEAVALYRYYTIEFPNIVVAWNDLGETYLQQGNKTEAKKCFEKALQLRPGNPRATENLKKMN
jgi:CubicO group peptidase (beta-lactamase class C family)